MLYTASGINCIMHLAALIRLYLVCEIFGKKWLMFILLWSLSLLSWNYQDTEVNSEVKARYQVTHFSDNDDGLSDSESEVTPRRIAVHGDGSLKQVKRDGSLRGIGDSPIALDYTPSDDFDMNVSPLEPFQEETNHEVMEFTIEDESPRTEGTDPEEIPLSILPEEATPVKKAVSAGAQIEEQEEEVSDDPETDHEVAQVLGQKIPGKPQGTPGKSQESPHQVPSDEEVESFNLVVLKHFSAHRQV